MIFGRFSYFKNFNLSIIQVKLFIEFYLSIYRVESTFAGSSIMTVAFLNFKYKNPIIFFTFEKFLPHVYSVAYYFVLLIAIFLVIDIERKNLIHIKGLTFDIRFDLNLIHQFSNFYDFMHCCGTKAGLKKNPVLLYIKNFPLSS